MRKLNQSIGDEFAKTITDNSLKKLYGVEYEHFSSPDISELKVRVSKKNELNREAGEYLTLDIINFSNKVKEKLITKLTIAIKQMMGKSFKKVLFLGMGNDNIISDSLGSATMDKIDILDLLEADSEVQFAKFSPSVFAVSGMESFDIIRAIENIFKPDVVIVVDSLCARSVERLGRSFQITDAGITPGSAVGSNVCKLTSETLGGAKVLSVGVPLVVYLQAVVEEALIKISPLDEYSLGTIDAFDGIYSPKEIDEYISFSSDVIAKALMRVFT